MLFRVGNNLQIEISPHPTPEQMIFDMILCFTNNFITDLKKKDTYRT